MKTLTLCLAMLAAAAGSACTERAWYEGVKQNQRNECYRQPPAAREECLKALESETYDAYQRKRQEELKQ